MKMPAIVLIFFAGIFGSKGGLRVMRKTGQMGAAVGLAASICKKYNAHPRDVYTLHLKEYLDLIETQK